MWLRIKFKNIVFSPFDCVLLTIFLLALIFIYLWLYWIRRKMPFQLKLIVHLILYIYTILVIVLVRNSVFHFLAIGGIASTCMMMNPAGADSGASSSEVRVNQGPLLPAPEGDQGYSSPSTPDSTSTSLVGHVSDETPPSDKEVFLTFPRIFKQPSRLGIFARHLTR